MASQGLGAEEKCLHLATALWCLRPKSWGEKPGQKGGLTCADPSMVFSGLALRSWVSGFPGLPFPGLSGFSFMAVREEVGSGSVGGGGRWEERIWDSTTTQHSWSLSAKQ